MNDEDELDSDDDLPGTRLEDLHSKDMTKDAIGDALMLGQEDYQEFRYGSVRFEKEQKLKKTQVFKHLLRL